MSATFSSPSSPTTGLAAYPIEKPVLNLYPGPNLGESRITKLRRLLAARRSARRGPSNAHDGRQMRKGNSQMPTMTDTIEEMVSLLSKSVADIVTAAPVDRDELLKKSFGEFQEMLVATTEDELGKLAEEVEATSNEEELYKGLGAVGRVANLIGMVASQVQRIKDGKDYSSDTNEADPASEEVADLLDHMVAVGGLALRAAVNEHVDFPEEGEEFEKGMTYVSVPLLKGGELTLKTALPEELSKFITDPDDIDAARVQSGSAMLIAAGISEQQLVKALGFDNELQKAGSPFPPKKKPAAPSDTDSGPSNPDSDAATDPAAADPTAGGSPDPANDPSQAPDPSMGGGQMPGTDDQGDDPLTVAGQLAAALLIQINHIQEIIQGTTDPSMNDPTAPQASLAPAAPSGMMGKRAPTIDEETLQKMVDARVEQELSSLRPQLEKMLGQPMPGRAVIGAAATPASLKAADTVFAPIDDDLSEEALAKMSPEDRFLVMTKAAFRRPVSIGAIG